MRIGYAIPLIVLLGLGAGCLPTQTVTTPPVAVPPEENQQTGSQQPTDVVVAPADPYEGWGTIEPGGVVSMRIPPGCKGDPGAGTIYVVCPSAENPTPTPEFTASSDGVQVIIRRWEGLASPYYDKFVASLRVIAPLDRDIRITVEK